MKGFEVKVRFLDRILENISNEDHELLETKPYLIDKVRRGEIRLSRFLKMVYPNLSNDAISQSVKMAKMSDTYKIYVEPPTFLQSKDYITRGDEDSCFVNLYLNHIGKSIHPFYIEFFGGKLFLVDGNGIEGRFLGMPSSDKTQWLYFNHYGLDTGLFLQLIKEMHKENAVSVRKITIDKDKNIHFNDGRAFLVNLKDDLHDFFVKCPNCGNVVSVKDVFLVNKMQIWQEFSDEPKKPYYKEVIGRFILYLQDASYLFLGDERLYDLLNYDCDDDHSKSLGFCGSEEECNNCYFHELDCIIAVRKFLIWSALNKFRIYIRCFSCL